MSEIRKTFLDYDARSEPLTARFCVKCQRDIRADRPARRVWMIAGEPIIVHPDDVGLVPADAIYVWLVGLDCARQIGSEWTRPETP